MILFLNCRHIVFIHIFVLYINLSALCGESTTRDINEVHDDFQINAEEILRRRKLVEPHLSFIAEKQKGWIETYHMSFSSDAIPSMQKAVSGIPVLTKCHGEIPCTESTDRTPKQKQPKEYKIDTQQLNVDNKRQESLHPEERARRHAIVEDFTPELKALEKGIGIDQVKLIGNKNTGTDGKTEMDAKEDISEPKVVDSSSLDSGHSAQDKYTETDHLKTEMNKLHSNFEAVKSSEEAVPEGQFPDRTGTHLSTVDTTSGAVNLVEGIDTSFNLVGNEHPSKISEMDLGHMKNDYCLVGDMKENFLNVIEKLTESKDVDLTRLKVSLLHEITHKKSYETNQHIFMSTAETNVHEEFKNYADPTEKVLKRRKLVKPFLSSLIQGKENWVETNHFNYEEAGTAEIHSRYFSPNHREVDRNIADVLEKVRIQERLFFQRWVKKLLNKFDDFPVAKHISIKFYLTTNSLNDLKILSESGNIKNADEFISDLISNADVHYGYNLSELFHAYSSVGLYIIISIVAFGLLYFTFFYYRVSRLILVLLLCLLWHTFKMYQEKVAEKHATVSGSSPAYCESILNKESGIFAHIKEFFRYKVYNEHCEKYYEALMIDPLSELSVSTVVFDFVSSTLCHVFRPVGRLLNILVKDMFRGLGFVQSFYVFILLIFLFALFVVFTLVYNKYKLTFPFFMGSAEPCLAPVGSRVEDISVKLSTEEDSPLKLTIPKDNDKSSLHHRKQCTVSPKIPPSDCDCQISRSLNRRFSF